MDISLTEVESEDGLKFVVLLGDLRGFSRNYENGETILQEFLRRFYIISSSCVESAGGKLVKFTGDGFMSVWPIHDENYRQNSKICQIVEATAFTLSGIVKITQLDLNIDSEIYLRQGITLETKATEIEYRHAERNFDFDYLGEKINLAFRLQYLPEKWPYLATHENFIDLKNHYREGHGFGQYERYRIEDENFRKRFQSSEEVNEIYTLELPDEKVIDDILENYSRGNNSEERLKNVTRDLASKDSTLSELLPDSSDIRFQNKLLSLSRDAPDWFKHSYVVYLRFLNAISEQIETIQDLDNEDLEQVSEAIDASGPS